MCLLASGIVPTASPYQRDEAIRCGLLVRLGKLCRLLLADTCEIGGGQQLALSRQIFDTTATLTYLSVDDDGSRHQAFVEDSLVAEREIVRDIDRRQSGDGGSPWAIEDRMRRSIHEAPEPLASRMFLRCHPERGSDGHPRESSRRCWARLHTRRTESARVRSMAAGTTCIATVSARSAGASSQRSRPGHRDHSRCSQSPCWRCRRSVPTCVIAIRRRWRSSMHDSRASTSACSASMPPTSATCSSDETTGASCS